MKTETAAQHQQLIPAARPSSFSRLAETASGTATGEPDPQMYKRIRLEKPK